MASNIIGRLILLNKKWVEGGMKGDMARGYRKANRLYADKTRANLIALYGMK
jgi:hypothetical protein